MIIDIVKLKEQLKVEQIFELLEEWGGDPKYTDFGIISATICHNPKGEGSHKLYYYKDSNLFHCFTECGCSFDIYSLFKKVYKIQKKIEYNAYEAAKVIGYRFGLIESSQQEIQDKNTLIDWEIFDRYTELGEITSKNYDIKLDEYNSNILNRFNYKVKLVPWLQEGITQEVLDSARIGFYPGQDQITIPHYDIDNRFIGLRGRSLSQDEAEQFGKYHPLKINRILYSHPLGMNLYNINHSKDNIKSFGKAIVFEGEKSTLQYRSYFGEENDISVACCGSSLSVYQVHMLLKTGAKEIVIAFDRQFKTLGDKEHQHLIENYKRIIENYKNYVNLSFIMDKNMITSYKASPTDEGAEKFMKLYKERVIV